MSLSGKLGDVSVLEAIQFIHSTQKTGALHFQQADGVKAQIYFQHGHIVRASTSAMTRIGDWLLLEGHITQEALKQALALQAESKPPRTLGVILKDMGQVTHDTIRDAVIFQLEEVIQKILTWKEGTFHFDAGDTNTPDEIFLMLDDLLLPEEVNTEFLLLEAVRKFDEARAQLEVPADVHVVRRSAVAVRELLITLHLKQFTGKVTLQKDELEKTLFFQKGNPVFVDSTIRSETLGQMLLENGTLTESQYDLILQKMESEGRRQGEILVELGFLSAFEVFELLKKQMAQKIQKGFLLNGASAFIEGGASHLENVPHLPTDFFRIFLHTLYDRKEPKSRINKLKGHSLLLNQRGRDYLSRQSLLPHETKILRLMDGARNWEEVLKEAGRKSKEAEDFVEALEDMGFLEILDRPVFKHEIQEPSPILGESKAPKEVPAGKSSPIYSWALRLDRPYHEILSINLHATRFQARDSFDAIVRDLHLDAIESHYMQKEQKVAELVLDRLTLCVTVLSDEKRAQDYVKNIDVWKARLEALGPAVSAEMCMRKAALHIAKRRFDKGEKEICKAIQFNPKESSYHLELADVLFHRAVFEKRKFPDRIERELTQARKLNSADGEAYFQFGRLAKAKNDLERAQKYFQRAVSLKPDHTGALSELRWLHRRLSGNKECRTSLRPWFQSWKVNPLSVREGKWLFANRLTRSVWVGVSLPVIVAILWIPAVFVRDYFSPHVSVSELQIPLQVEQAMIQNDGLIIIAEIAAWRSLSRTAQTTTLKRLETVLKERKLRQGKIRDKYHRNIAVLMHMTGAGDPQMALRVYE